MSQPALSKRLRHLEAVAGTRLLERSPQGVVATPAGSRLATSALRVIDEVALLDGCSPSCAGRVPRADRELAGRRRSTAPRAARRSRDALTGLPIELTAANSTVVRRLVESGAADLGIVATEDPESDPGRAVIATDEVVVVVPSATPGRTGPACRSRSSPPRPSCCGIRGRMRARSWID